MSVHCGANNEAKPLGGMVNSPNNSSLNSYLKIQRLNEKPPRLQISDSKLGILIITCRLGVDFTNMR
jgi:hypothetical protein